MSERVDLDRDELVVLAALLRVLMMADGQVTFEEVRSIAEIGSSLGPPPWRTGAGSSWLMNALGLNFGIGSGFSWKLGLVNTFSHNDVNRMFP